MNINKLYDTESLKSWSDIFGWEVPGTEYMARNEIKIRLFAAGFYEDELTGEILAGEKTIINAVKEYSDGGAGEE